MQVNIKYFASLREAMGQGSEQRQTEALDLAGLREEMIASSAKHAAALTQIKSVRMALNQVMCDASARLTPGCEVAFFPPVTGG
ncbi:Molybdopterin synthase sulfur carrier subunit [Polaromonas vacuolata]|uniref:Molybdopterin synthase sulfur carrier subunit n=1 Tax=Polaromonas vacuolata TaxID=37448 RepID=A0A6H2HB49_9BURK|nr:MoaD/ThiS family protein [Polaromonas vacuolata]QJC57050.1 Molybdopterin synthase sulfur carrier subunit [Polaromonas vacuolata]